MDTLEKLIDEIAVDGPPPRYCGTCANWMQLSKAPHAGFCRIASAERTTHSGQMERFGLMTTDLQVCSQWMDAHPK